MLNPFTMMYSEQREAAHIFWTKGLNTKFPTDNHQTQFRAPLRDVDAASAGSVSNSHSLVLRMQKCVCRAVDIASTSIPVIKL